MKRGLPLTARELRALAMYAETADHTEAAHRLGIPAATWRGRLAVAYEKLGVTSAIAAFWALGWLRPFLRSARVALGNSGQGWVGLT